jgi:hypothetical protein
MMDVGFAVHRKVEWSIRNFISKMLHLISRGYGLISAKMSILVEDSNDFTARLSKDSCNSGNRNFLDSMVSKYCDICRK